MREITLTIESDIQNLTLVAVGVHRICEQLGAGKEAASEIELCVNEAVANCIHHAYSGASGPQLVLVRIVATAGEIQCTVCDHGHPMPAEQIGILTTQPNGPEYFDEKNNRLDEHGRGLKIIAALMDEVAYLHEGDENCLRMKKHIQH